MYLLVEKDDCVVQTTPAPVGAIELLIRESIPPEILEEYDFVGVGSLQVPMLKKKEV